MRLLRQLHLNDNEISYIERSTFDTIARIGTINLAGNKITKIDYQMFNELQYVEVSDKHRVAYGFIMSFYFENIDIVFRRL